MPLLHYRLGRCAEKAHFDRADGLEGEAFKNYKIAAEQGEPMAYFRIGGLCENNRLYDRRYSPQLLSYFFYASARHMDNSNLPIAKQTLINDAYKRSKATLESNVVILLQDKTRLKQFFRKQAPVFFSEVIVNF